MYSKLWIG